MPLTVGASLGPYEIVQPLGAGGMGEVYRARDTRLNRDVAIKVIRNADPALQSRLAREAKAIAALSHPHICALHDIGRDDGVDYLVMECLEGETIADRLKGGALPLDQAFRYAIQIADALDAAHRAGIVHRDLKPANVMITKAGAKLLDFGLAKVRAAAIPGGATMTVTQGPHTAEGSLVGTLQYMAPEQLEGRDADVRSDIFAFGAMLFEMVTGRRPFDGDSQASVIAAILDRDPPVVSALSGRMCPALDRATATALNKDPDERWQSIADVKRELEWIAADVDTEATKQRQHISSRRLWVAGLAGVAIVAAAVGALAVWLAAPRRAADTTVSRTIITLPVEGWFAPSGVSWSPDGTRIAFIVTSSGISGGLIYVRRLDQFDAAPLRGTDGALQAFFSPDGEWIGFDTVDDKLKKVSLSTGAVTTICEVPIMEAGADWGRDQTIVFAGYTEGRRSSLWRVSADGGTPARLADPDAAKGETALRYPQFIPGSDVLLVTVWLPSRGGSRFAVDAMSMRTRERHRLAENVSYARSVPGNRIAYVTSEGSLMVGAFDPAGLRLRATPTAVLDGLAPNETGFAPFAVSTTGALAYLAERSRISEGAFGSLRPRTLVRVDRHGIAAPLNAPSAGYDDPRLSPDGRRLAMTIRNRSGRDVWIYDLARESLTQFTFGGASATAVWTPDGRRLVFWSDDGRRNLFWQPADRSAAAERLLTNPDSQWPASFTPDGRLLTYMQNDANTEGDVWALPFDGDRRPRPVVRLPHTQYGGRLSPDGRWVAYSSDETGRFEIYVTPLSGGGKVQVSTNGGEEAVWARSGRELFFRNGTRMMTASVGPGDGSQIGKPSVLFDRRYVSCCPGLPEYDVAPDDRTFFMLQDAGELAPPQLKLVLHWADELGRTIGATGR